MKILVANPNSTPSMTETIAEAARGAARPGTEIVAANPPGGPPSIEGFLDVANCAPHLLDVVRAHPDADAVVVACFDDTGVDAVRCVTEAPVIGIGEAAYHAASMVSPKFGVVTTLARSVPGIEANLLRYGFDRRCARVRATDIPVLDVDEGSPETVDKIRAEIRLAIAEDRIEAVVLGCAGMADLAGQLTAEFGLPVIDGVSCAVGFCEALVQAGLSTSKSGSYAPKS